MSSPTYYVHIEFPACTDEVAREAIGAALQAIENTTDEFGAGCYKVTRTVEMDV